MLTSIQIKNFALIESLELDLQSGMTVITGETGAGKSIVIDALGLALGERADVSVIRHGTDKADISASFDIAVNSPASKWLADNELDESGECILRRVLAREGRSKCFINGRSATLSMLKDLGDLLVDIHGQHAHQSLLKPAQQLMLLDELIDDRSLISQLHELSGQYHSVARKLRELQKDQEQRQERAELLSYQLNELEALQLTSESIKQLESDHAKAANIQELTQTTQQANDQLFEQDSSLYDTLSHYLQEFSELSTKDPALQATAELLANACASLEETKAELRGYNDSLEIDPNMMQELEERMTALFDLARKHQVDMQQLPATEQSIRDELEGLTTADQDSHQLEQQKQQLAEQYQVIASKLSKARVKAAKALSKGIEQQMAILGMEGGVFNIEFTDYQDSFSRHGQEQVEFQVSANPGQPTQSLAKVASGGELSRISLAIQVITAQKRVTPCLIFDEVDVGIGGQTADVVGRMLADIAKHAQVLCVTHQPQVAARGDQHLIAAKQRHANSTETNMQLLSEELRVDEIARMVGGLEITESTLNHAKELLAS
ncbi:MAG: DNA repair protein RecN [Kangiellaceae bacterium]|jgi:DNA repair protein RecN (Recombination protein N)|nr:DNA repair protein RecN [Kangiellaceae bacterium]